MNTHFDLSFSHDGKSFDIIFKETFKKESHKLTTIIENPLIESCEEKEEKIFNEYDSEEEKDESIVKFYEGIRYVTFPGIDGLYTEKDLIYVGKSGCSDKEVYFTPKGGDIHKSSLKTIKI